MCNPSSPAVPTLIVTIDGPAGSGKSTVARKLARKLGLIHLNSGALYRAVALLAGRAGVRLEDEEALVSLATKQKLELRVLSGETSAVIVSEGGQLKSEEFRSSEVGNWASQVAVHPKLREFLTNVQRKFGQENSIVLEGRDSGSVVFPNASFKFFLDASPEVRAKRRQIELGESVEEVEKEMQARDRRDSSRSASPSVVPKGAITIDTSAMNVDEVIESILNYIGKG